MIYSIVMQVKYNGCFWVLENFINVFKWEWVTYVVGYIGIGSSGLFGFMSQILAYMQRRSATNITQESNIEAGAEAKIYNIELYISGYKVTSGAISTTKKSHSISSIQ